MMAEGLPQCVLTIPSNPQIVDVADAPIPGSPKPEFTVGGENEDESEIRKIIVGVCAMAKKAHSTPMQEILDRLAGFEHLQILIFDEHDILNEPVDKWPVVDALISFHSKGFPLSKALEYSRLVKPYVLNDIEMQFAIQDRREVYKILMKEGILHPRYAVLERDSEGHASNFVETEDSIEINSDVVFQKPFVEKPVSAEDHNVYIYFPACHGGGSQRLFRKIGTRSSVYSQISRVRKKGSYIYEDFMPTDGTDVKVYTVGLDYAHAEARKSPALDGKVERDKNGKEIRYPVLLSAKEKLLARNVCVAFKQTVCGFDLLRANGKSYVCDVNGFSFVKTSNKYYDDCAKIIGTSIVRALAPQLSIPISNQFGTAPEDIPVVPTTSGTLMELRCVIAVIRHGDRTPKQKMKMEVKHKKFFDLFEKYGGYNVGHLKLKKPKQLQEVLDIARFLLSEQQLHSDPEMEEKKSKLEQLKLVLEMYGHFSGINRKVQFKYQPHGRPNRSSSEDGINRKVQLKYQPYGWPFQRNANLSSYNEEPPPIPSLVLIVKWGGELTPAGRIQAEDLGKAFRTLYPGGQGEFGSPGLGFLRLHSTFRHDLKIYASDEGRVQMTAAAFAKGLLALEGDRLTPIVSQMVKSANTNGLLDDVGGSVRLQTMCDGNNKNLHIGRVPTSPDCNGPGFAQRSGVKETLKDILNHDGEFTEEDYMRLAPTNSISLRNAMDFIKNPKEMCDKLEQMVHEITARIRSLKKEIMTRDSKLYNGESWELLMRRWAKLEKDFKLKNGRFDTSKIPDIYDCIKYDLQHNQKVLKYDRAEELFMCSKALADVVIPQEYGITKSEKLHIGQSYCTPLMRKIQSDLQQCIIQPHEDEDTTRLDSRYSKGVSTPHRFVRTRLYFTSESHIHSLLTMLRYSDLCDEATDMQWKRAMDFLSATAELNYMTQIVVMMFEDPNQPLTCDERFHIELHFSPGAYTCCDPNKNYPASTGYRPQSQTSTQKKRLDVTNHNSYLSEIANEVRKTSLSEAEELEESDMCEKEKVKSVKRKSRFEVSKNVDVAFVCEQTTESSETTTTEQLKKPSVDDNGNPSPDPNVPEWDWGDDATETTSQPMKKETLVDGPPVEVHSEPTLSYDKSEDRVSREGPRRVSQPIEIISQKAESSSEEKRSRSLEEKNREGVKADGSHSSMTGVKPKYRHSLSSDFQLGTPDVPLVDRHYLTVHLPLEGQHRSAHSISSLFSFKPDAFQGLLSTCVLMGSASAPDLVTSYRLTGHEGTEGIVPALRPLETLHNALTLKDLNAFLIRATTNKYPDPMASPPRDLPVLGVRQGFSTPAGVSLCSSTCSSAGPSSPCSTPVDFATKLKTFIDSSKQNSAVEVEDSGRQLSEMATQAELPKSGS